MTDWQVIFNSIASVMALLGVIWVAAVKITAMEVKIDTVWGFLMKRAMSEALVQGVATRNSPVKVTNEAKQWMAPLIGPIREFYATLGRRNMSDEELALEIERRFGDRILHEVCIPHGLYMGACLLIALQALKGTTPEGAPASARETQR
jgi:hypothetical protein